jgi:hypothetical protein
MLLPAILAAVSLSALPVRVEASECPSVVEVEQSLAAILPSVAVTAVRDVAHVLRLGNRLDIELVNSDGAVLATRQIEQTGSCADLAALVAVVIASWESDVHPEFSRAAPAPMREVAARPPGKPSPSAARPSGGYDPSGYDLAAGGAVSWADSLALGGALAATWIPRGDGLGARVFGEVETSRTVDLGQRQARWQRWHGSLEIDWRTSRVPSVFDVHAGLALGWLSASGVNFDSNQSAGALSQGMTIGARWAWWLGRDVAVFADIAAVYWLRTQTIYSSPDGIQQDIPHFQGLASLGLAVGKSSPRP